MRWPPYPTYRPSGLEWLGDVPAHWEALPLKRRLRLVNGGTPSSSEESYWQGHINWITPEDLGGNDSKRIGSSRRTLSFEGLSNSGAQLVPPDSIVISTRAPIGHLAVTERESCTNQGCRALVSVDRCVCADYVYYSLVASRPVLQAVGKGTTFMELSALLLGLHVVPFPPQNEQCTIADFLDRETAKIDTLVAKKRTLIDRLRENRSVLISRTVTHGLPPAAARAAGFDPHPKLKPTGIDWLGDVPEHWEVKRLKHLVTAIEQGWSPDCDNAPAAPDEWGVLKAGCCNGGKFVPEENKALPVDIGVPLHLEIQSGDLLMSRASGSEDLVGSAALVPEGTRPRLLLSDKIYRLLCGVSIVPALLARLLQSPLGRVQVEAFISGASGLAKNIAQSDVKSLLFPTPPFTEQRAIVDFLNRETAKIDGMIAKVETAIERLQEYRTALITAAVTGRIDVRKAIGHSWPVLVGAESGKIQA